VAREVEMKWLVLNAAVIALACSSVPEAYAQGGKACMNTCLSDLRSRGELNKFPRGYCREKCNYYGGAPADVLQSAGRINGKQNACLSSCRTKMRAQPGFQKNPKNARYCKDKCGIR